MYNWEGDASEVGPRILPRAGEECGEIGYGPLYSPLRAVLFTPDQEFACLGGQPVFWKIISGASSHAARAGGSTRKGKAFTG